MKGEPGAVRRSRDGSWLGTTMLLAVALLIGVKLRSYTT